MDAGSDAKQLKDVSFSVWEREHAGLDAKQRNDPDFGAGLTRSRPRCRLREAEVCEEHKNHRL